jgi:hypothetical protein
MWLYCGDKFVDLDELMYLQLCLSVGQCFSSIRRRESYTHVEYIQDSRHVAVTPLHHLQVSFPFQYTHEPSRDTLRPRAESFQLQKNPLDATT